MTGWQTNKRRRAATVGEQGRAIYGHRIRRGIAFCALSTALSGATGCGKSASEESTEKTAVYLCSETNEVVRAPLQPSPAINPETGRKTLMRALYCKKCERWHAVPPAVERSGNPLRYHCPRHKAAMSPDGPVDGN